MLADGDASESDDEDRDAGTRSKRRKPAHRPAHDSSAGESNSESQQESSSFEADRQRLVELMTPETVEAMTRVFEIFAKQKGTGPSKGKDGGESSRKKKK